MTREQEAIDLLNEHGMPARFTEAALSALLSPSPCPTCGGRAHAMKAPNRGLFGSDDPADYPCPDCTDGTVPPLLRWNEQRK